MTTWRTTKLIDARPSYDVLEIAPSPALMGAIVLMDGDTLGVKHDQGFYRRYRISSVASSALKDNRDPIDAIESAKARGHALHFIFALATCISSSPQAKETLISVTPGTLVFFQGRFFTIVPKANDNLGLKAAELAEA